MSKDDQDVAKEQFWREAVARQASSGLSVRVFCQQEQLRCSESYHRADKLLSYVSGQKSQAVAKNDLEKSG
jgi:hypothetical protein